MLKKIIVGEFAGSKFTVENTWLSGAKLFHGSELIATNNDTFAVKKDKAMIRAKVIVNEVERVVEVFAFAILTVKLQIKVDGEKIAGDEF